MEKLKNVKTGKIGEVIDNGDKVTLNIDGQHKQYSQSTIKRWWKPYIEPQTSVILNEVYTHTTEVENKVQVDKNDPHCEQNLPILAQSVINTLLENGCTCYETKSYIGIKMNNSTLMEIHYTKKGKTTLIVDSKSFDSSIIEELVNAHVGKVVPKNYGWRLNFKINADSIQDVISSIVLPVYKYAIS